MIGIFIPTCDRPEFVKRALSYYNKKSDILNNVNFYIYDASNELNSIKNSSEISKYKNLNIKYKRFASQKNEFDRLYKSLLDINDEYVLQVGDDDFIIAESLKPAQIFLDTNNDYIACSGLRSSFILENSKDNVKGTNIKITRTVPGPYWPINDPILSFKTYMRTGIPMQHFLVRNNIYKKMYSHLNENTTKISLLSQDLLPCMILSLSGNIKRLDYHLSFIRQESKISTYKSLSDIFLEDNFSSVLRYVKEYVTKEILKYNNGAIEIVNREFLIRFTQLLQWEQETKYPDNNNDFNIMQEKNKFVPATQMYYQQIIRDIYEVCKSN